MDSLAQIYTEGTVKLSSRCRLKISNILLMSINDAWHETDYHIYPLLNDSIPKGTPVIINSLPWYTCHGPHFHSKYALIL